MCVCVCLWNVQVGGGSPTVDSLTEMMLSVSEADFTSGKASSLGWKCTPQGPGDIVWIPCGWMIATKVTEGSLVYGVRKSRVTATTETVKSLEVCVQLYTASGKDTTRMKQLLSAVRKAVSEGQASS